MANEYLVSIHAPFGCDAFRLRAASLPISFNPRTVWVRLNPLDGKGVRNEFQSTHRLGATILPLRYSTYSSVSIHAPFGCDGINATTINAYCEFQSTHPFGCDVSQSKPAITLSGFNPRTRLGATSASSECSPSPKSFNPRTRLGATSVALDAAKRRVVSIHAPVWVRPMDFQLSNN